MSSLNVSIHKLSINESMAGKEDNLESCFIILSGRCRVEIIEDKKSVYEEVGQRDSVFNGQATAVYIPIKTYYKISAMSERLEIVQISAYANDKMQAFVVRPDEIVSEVRGNEIWKRRVDSIVDSKKMTNGLIIGETVHLGGWSGYPPHKHDIDNYPWELAQSEVYFIKIEPTSGFGIFVNYKEEVSTAELTILQDESQVFVKNGYHCVVSSPDCQFYYLWALAHKEREVVYSVDKKYIEEE